MIREEEAPKPSTRLSDSGEALASISAQRHMEPAKLTKLLRGELDWIVLKTLEKDRNRRYETANGFAADVQRYLNDEPVEACPPSVAYRLRKFARRNKGLIGTVGTVAAVLVLGTVVSAWQAIRAWIQEWAITPLFPMPFSPRPKPPARPAPAPAGGRDIYWRGSTARSPASCPAI